MHGNMFRPLFDLLESLRKVSGSTKAYRVKAMMLTRGLNDFRQRWIINTTNGKDALEVTFHAVPDRIVYRQTLVVGHVDHH